MLVELAGGEYDVVVVSGEAVVATKGAGELASAPGLGWLNIVLITAVETPCCCK